MTVPATVSAVLWDVDGTLMSSGGVAARAFLDAVGDIAGTRPDPDGLDFGGRIDPEIAALLLDSVGGDRSAVPDVLRVYRQLLAGRRDELAARTRTLPGVTDLVQRLAAAGVRQTVLTGNIETVAGWKLSATGLAPPIDLAVGGFGDRGADRTAVGRWALAQLEAAGWRAPPGGTWIVGDTARDLQCARALGLSCALVASGRHPVSALSGLGADLVLDSLAGADELLRRWGLG